MFAPSLLLFLPVSVFPLAHLDYNFYFVIGMLNITNRSNNYVLRKKILFFPFFSFLFLFVFL